MESQGQRIRRYVGMRLKSWMEETNEARIKGDLAQLRRGIGKKPGEIPEIWELIFSGFPEELMSKGEEASWAEWAVSTSLCMYALHQQGKNIHKENMHKEHQSLGQAVRKLAPTQDDPDLARIRKRFTIFATAADIEECAYYLRGLVQLLRAKEIPMDYVQLAYDLYEFQINTGAAKVRLRWGQDFYRISKQEEEEIKNE